MKMENVASAIVDKIAPAEKPSEDEAKQMANEELERGADRFIKAVKSGMASEAAKAFKDMHEVCNMWPEDEEASEGY